MEGWCRLCFGRYHARLAADNHVADTPATGSTDSQSDRLTSDIQEHGSPPLLSVISQIDQVLGLLVP